MRHTKEWHTLNRGQSIDFVCGDMMVVWWKDNGAHFVRLRDRRDCYGPTTLYTTTVTAPNAKQARSMWLRARRLAKALSR